MLPWRDLSTFLCCRQHLDRSIPWTPLASVLDPADLLSSKHSQNILTHSKQYNCLKEINIRKLHIFRCSSVRGNEKNSQRSNRAKTGESILANTPKITMQEPVLFTFYYHFDTKSNLKYFIAEYTWPVLKQHNCSSLFQSNSSGILKRQHVMLTIP